MRMRFPPAARASAVAFAVASRGTIRLFAFQCDATESKRQLGLITERALPACCLQCRVEKLVGLTMGGQS